MQALTIIDLARIACVSANKPGLYVSFYQPDGEENFSEIVKAAPYLDILECGQMLADGHGVILFDTDEERDHAYDQTVGDEGPTKLNPYNGSARVYALTISKEGEPLNENT